MRVDGVIALSVGLAIATIECPAGSAQQQSDSAQSKGLDRIFQTRSRMVVPPYIERLEAALHDTASDPLAKEIASDEIAIAQNALNNAIAALRIGRKSDAERAKKVVEAALLLASRKTALERARKAIRETKQRAAEAKNAAKRAADELEAALQKRAAIYLGRSK